MFILLVGTELCEPCSLKKPKIFGNDLILIRDDLASVRKSNWFRAAFSNSNKGFPNSYGWTT